MTSWRFVEQPFMRRGRAGLERAGVLASPQPH
jgi:peptidoglycan/LPS O-acetylase OafA/YrhL